MSELISFVGYPLMDSLNYLKSLLSLRCAFRGFGQPSLDSGKLLSSSLKNRGLAIFSPLDRVAKLSKPTSTPTRVPSFQGGLGRSSTSTEKHAYHFPVAARRTVSRLILPSMGRWSLILISPILERWICSSLSLNPI